MMVLSGPLIGVSVWRLSSVDEGRRELFVCLSTCSCSAVCPFLHLSFSATSINEVPRTNQHTRPLHFPDAYSFALAAQSSPIALHITLRLFGQLADARAFDVPACHSICTRLWHLSSSSSTTITQHLTWLCFLRLLCIRAYPDSELCDSLSTYYSSANIYTVV